MLSLQKDEICPPRLRLEWYIRPDFNLPTRKLFFFFFFFFAHTKCDWKLNIFKTNDRSALRSTKKDIVVE